MIAFGLGVVCSGVYKVNITMPEYLLSEIDRYAEQYHLTRSGLLAQAAGQYIHRKQ